MRFIAILLSAFVVHSFAAEPVTRTSLWVVSGPGGEIHGKLGDWAKVSVSTPEVEASEAKPLEYKVTSTDKGFAIVDVVPRTIARKDNGKELVKNVYTFYVTFDKKVISEIDIAVKDGNGEGRVKQYFMSTH